MGQERKKERNFNGRTRDTRIVCLRALFAYHHVTSHRLASFSGTTEQDESHIPHSQIFTYLRKGKDRIQHCIGVWYYIHDLGSHQSSFISGKYDRPQGKGLGIWELGEAVLFVGYLCSK